MQTFLFTDIESSTRLWEEHPNEMASSLARHDAILSEAIAGADGTVLKTTGDGAIAIFDSPSNAIAASITAQQALAAEPWGSAGPIRVRMGVHAGETERRDGDYFGPVMNRAARIMAAGHGGQVLLSSAAKGMTTDTLPAEAILRDLGPHRLKDLTVPEHLFQLIHPDLQTEFPPPTTLDATPNNLPVQTTEFLGRHQELAAIQLMLESPATRLLTIAGPGGAGKTRLGLQVGAELMDSFRDGVFFVDVSSETDPDSAFEAIVRALDLPASGTGGPLDVLKTRLRDRQMLLVLDNFEQVIAAGSGVSEILQSAPDLKVVITSRETLRVRAEQVYPVPPLSLPDPSDPTPAIAESEAVQLFMDRARAVRPDITLDDENARTIAEICLRLDGLPLAIELATARLNVFTPSDLLARLRKRLDVLGAGGRDLPDRQRTLWGAIGWSYELLTDDERNLFDLFSVFSTTGLPALESVAESAMGLDFVLDDLSSLVDKSLIRKHTHGTSFTFSMLLMIKEYAEERLADEPERENQVREAHARYFSEFALGLQDRLRGRERESALEELETEIGNLRTAWRYWVDVGALEQLFNLLDGLWALHEAKGWYHAAIELATDTLGVLATAETSADLATEELTLRTSLARALLAVRGYTVEVEEEFKRVLDLADSAGTVEQRFPVLRALASYYVQTGDARSALGIGKELLELGEERNDQNMIIEGHSVIGISLIYTDVENCLAHLDKAIDLYDPARHPSNRFHLGPNTGVIARMAAAIMRWERGDLEQAVNRAADGLQMARDIDHPYSIAYALYHNGFLAIMRGKFEECLGFAKELAQISDENDYVLWLTLSTVLEGVSRTALGEVETGLAMTEAGVEFYKGLTTPPVFWPTVLMLRSGVHAMAGDPKRALELVDEAITAAETGGVISPEIWVVRADLIKMTSDAGPDIAEGLYERAQTESSEMGLRLTELKAIGRLVQLRREQGRSPDGTDELARVYEEFTEGFDEGDLMAAKTILDV
jgi:predicted ATPase/class 3 adenylate cyclase